MKPGYKQTEVGVIPSNWEVVPLRRVASFRTGPFGSALHMSDYTVDGLPIVNPMHIVDARIVPNQAMTITSHAARTLSDFLLRSDDIVIARRGDMGRCAVVRKRENGWLCGTGSMIIRPLPSTVRSEFLQRIVSGRRVVSALEGASVGSTMNNLNQAILGNIPIPLPPLREQEAIAEALSDADALTQSLEKLIEKKRAIKQGAMQELLTGKRRLPGFTGKWEEKRLGEVCRLSKAGILPGITPQRMFMHFSLPAYDAGQLPISEPGGSIGSHKFTVPPRAILLSKLNPRIPRVWCPAEVPSNAIASTEFLVLQPLEGIDRSYLFCALTSTKFMDSMELLVSGTTGSHQRIAPHVAMSICVHMPVDIREQKIIGGLLSDMDSEISTLHDRLRNVRFVKQGMMQELLTGRVRLV